MLSCLSVLFLQAAKDKSNIIVNVMIVRRFIKVGFNKMTVWCYKNIKLVGVLIV